MPTLVTTDPATERLRRWLRWGLYALIVLTPLPFGSVTDGAVLAIQIFVVLVWILSLSATAGPSSRLDRILVWICFGFVATGFIQCLPLAMIDPQDIANTSSQSRTLAPLSAAPPQTVAAVLRLAAVVLVLLVARKAFADRHSLLTLRCWVTLAATFQGLYGAFELLSGREQIFSYERLHYLGSATGTFINRNHFAGYLACALPLALSLAFKSKDDASRGLPRSGSHRIDLARWLGWLGTVACVAGIALSGSRFGFALSIVATMLYLALAPRRGRRRLAVLALLLVTAPLLWLVTQNVTAPGERFLRTEELATLNRRLPVWMASLEMFRERPWLGVGYGSFSAVFPAYQDAGVENRWDHAHSDVLQLSAEAGVLGLSLLAAGIFGFGTVIFRQRSKGAWSEGHNAILSAIVVVSLHSMVDFPLRIPAIAVLLMVLAGSVIASAGTSEVQAQRSHSPSPPRA